MAADYTSANASDRLAAVRKAIHECLISQSYGTRQRNQQKARLSDLRELEKDLILEEQRASEGGTMATVGVQVRTT